MKVRNEMTRPTETCPECLYTSPYVNVAKGRCPKCFQEREAKLGEAIKAENERARAEALAAAAAEHAHRWGRPHATDLCVMCLAAEPLPSDPEPGTIPKWFKE